MDNISIYLFQDNGVWIAQCLEHDICAQGKTMQSALDSLERVILDQIHLDTKHGNEPLQDIEPAPYEIVYKSDNKAGDV